MAHQLSFCQVACYFLKRWTTITSTAIQSYLLPLKQKWQIATTDNIQNIMANISINLLRDLQLKIKPPVTHHQKQVTNKKWITKSISVKHF